MKFLLVDLSAIFRRHWHVAEGEPLNEARSRTLNDVRSLAQGFDRVAICCDAGRKCFRHDLFPEYKAHREKAGNDLYELMDRARDDLGKDGYHVFSADGFEADDVIATLVSWLRETWVFAEEKDGDLDIVIASPDKDLFQLLSDDTSVLRTHTNAIVNLIGFREKFGFEPSEHPDYLAMVGDTSDGLPGAKGIGPKIAGELLSAYGPTLDDVYEAVHSESVASGSPMTPKRRTALTDAEADVKQSKKLIILAKNAPIECGKIMQEHKQQQLTDLDVDGGPPSDDVPVVDAEPVSDPAPANSADEADCPPPEAAIVVRNPQWERQLEPTSRGEAWKIAQHVMESRLFRKFANEHAVMVLLMAGRSYGLDAIQSLRGIYIVEGKPELSAQLMMALCLRHPKCEYFTLIESTAEKAVYETMRTGAPSPVRMTYTIGEAQDAGLVRGGGNWSKRPKTMLRNRCVAELARAVYPDAVHDTYEHGEIEA